MRVVVTGAAGYVGRAVVRRLSMAGHEVLALVHREPSSPLNVPSRLVDLLDPTSLDDLGRVDGVCHLAARTQVRESFDDPVGYFQANVTGTLNFLDALKSQASPPAVVLASTGAVYGVPGDEPIEEDTPPVPFTPYGASKLASEHAVQWHARTGAISAVILRTFNVAGAVDGFPDPEASGRIIPKILAVCAGTADALHVNGDGSAVREWSRWACPG